MRDDFSSAMIRTGLTPLPGRTLIGRSPSYRPRLNTLNEVESFPPAERTLLPRRVCR